MSKSASNSITIAIASHPPRAKSLLNTLNTLLPQCDRLCLYLNNYSESYIDELMALEHSSKLEIELSGIDPDTGEQRELPNIRCHGKMYWMARCKGYYLTCDDDCIYPQDYVSEMVTATKKYDNKAIVVCSGGVKAKGGTTIWFVGPESEMPYNTPVNFHGGGWAIMHPSTLKIPEEMATFAIDDAPNYIEDCLSQDLCLSVWANVHGIPMIYMAKDKGWIVLDKAVSKAPHAIENSPQITQRKKEQEKKLFKYYNSPFKWAIIDSPAASLESKNQRIKKPSDCVTIGMASHPPRKDGVALVLNKLLPQCDRFCLYLNNYSKSFIDTLPKSDKLEIILAGVDPDTGEEREYKDLRPHGKLYWANDCKGYYLTVDDDTDYPDDYVKKIVEAIDYYGRKAIITAHGHLFRKTNNNGLVFNKRGIMLLDVINISQESPTYVQVDSGANISTAFHPSALKMKLEFPENKYLNQDDETICLWAKKNNVAIVRLPTTKNWIKPYKELHQVEALDSLDTKMVYKTERLSEITNWSFAQMPCVAVKAISERPICIDKEHEVVIGMASHPPREEGMLRRINELLPQCDRLCLYLNKYPDSILSKLPKSDKLEVILAGEGRKERDRSSFGKLFWAGKHDGFYFTVDDDLVFPRNYVDTMLSRLKEYENRFIVTVHGKMFKMGRNREISVVDGRIECSTLSYKAGCNYNVQVHSPGNGVTAYHAKRIGLTYDALKATKGTHHDCEDDMVVAIWALRNKVPVVRIRCDNNWIRTDWGLAYTDALYSRGGQSERVINMAREISDWRLPRVWGI